MPWTEEQIRQYQEAHGINYGQGVFERGVKPYREWSNDRFFGNQPSSSEPINEVRNDIEKEELKAEVESLKKLVEQMLGNQMTKEVSVPASGVERHTKPLDKRTKEYKESLKQA